MEFEISGEVEEGGFGTSCRDCDEAEFEFWIGRTVMESSPAWQNYDLRCERHQKYSQEQGKLGRAPARASSKFFTPNMARANVFRARGTTLTRQQKQNREVGKDNKRK